MIKFFRKIRQKLLSKNKFSKYLIYAIGEIVLVVIGILIALQINNWNEYDKNQALAQKYLKLIKSDLELDIEHFETLNKGLTQQAMKIDSIENILSRPQTKQEEFKEIIRNNSTVFAVIEDTNLNTSTFSALQNSGRIDLLDKDLQDGLRKLNQEQYRYKEYTNDNIDAMLKEFSNYVQEIPAFANNEINIININDGIATDLWSEVDWPIVQRRFINTLALKAYTVSASIRRIDRISILTKEQLKLLNSKGI